MKQKLISFSTVLSAVPSGMEKRYACCGRSFGSAGCQVAKVGIMFSESLCNAVYINIWCQFGFLCPFDLKLGHSFL